MKLMKKITKLLLLFSLICCVSSQPDITNYINDGVVENHLYMPLDDSNFFPVLPN